MPGTLLLPGTLLADIKVASERIDVPPVSDVMRIFKLKSCYGDDPCILAYRPARKHMGLYRYRNGKLSHMRRATPWAEIVQAALVYVENERKIAVAYHYFPESPKEKFKIVLYDTDLDFPEVIFEQTTYRGAVTALQEVEGKLLITFIHSESYSKGGLLEYNQVDGNWKFNRLFAGKEQWRVQAIAETVAVATRLPTNPERSTAVEVKVDEDWFEGESDRGVSAISLLQYDGDGDLELLVGDGLADEQRKRSNPQIALLDLDRDSKKYKRQWAQQLRAGDSYAERIDSFMLGGKRRIIVKGRQFVTLYSPDDNWSRETLYRKKSENALGTIDYLMLDNSEEGFVFAVLDGGELELRTYGKTEFAGEKVESEPVAVEAGGITLVHYLSDEVVPKSETTGLQQLWETGARLDLAKTEVTDSDLAQLQSSSFNNVRWLNLSETGITDAGLKYLKKLPLQTLILESSEVTGSGFKALRGLPLKELILENTPVNNEGLKNLQGSSVEVLDLTGTHVTDEGMENLQGLNLKVLNLYSTNITDAGLQYLLTLPLKKLYLTGTQVTDQEVERLKSKYPELYVIY